MQSLNPSIPPGLPPALVRGLSASERTARWRPGIATGCRHAEIFAAGGEGSGAGFALSLAREALRNEGWRCAPGDPAADTPDERAWLWVQDKAARRLSGRPYRPGLPPDLRHRLIHVAADKAEDALFALEEGLRCRDLAFVIGEIAGNPRALDFTASRRLSLAAERHGVPLWLVRLDAACDLGSARMRWKVVAAPSLAPRWNGHAPGAASWRAELFRAHTFQPGQWTLRDEGSELAFSPATIPATSGAGDLVRASGDRSLAAG